MQSSYSQSVYTKRTASGVSSDLALQFGLSTSSTNPATQQQQLDQLNAIYTSRIQLTGGSSPGSYQPDQWPTWANTVPTNPIPTSMLLVPHSLVSLVTSVQQQALTQALSNYLAAGTFIQPMSIPLNYFGGVEIGSLIYTLGGNCGALPGSHQQTSSVFTYSAESNSWSSILPLPKALDELSSVVLNDRIFVMGGDSTGGTSNSVFSYNPQNPEWLFEISMPYAVQNLASATAGSGQQSMIVSFGGWDGSQIQNLAMSYIPGSNWQILPSMPTAREKATAVTVGNKTYVIGVWSGSQYLATVEFLSIENFSWGTAPSLITPRVGAASLYFNNSIYVIGGESSQGILNSVEIYDFQTDSWHSASPMQVPRAYFTAQILNGLIYAVGGQTSSSSLTTSVEALDINSGTWSLHQKFLFC